MKPDAILTTLSKDLHRYGGKSGFWGFVAGLKIPGFRYTYFLRKAGSTSNRSVSGIFYRFMLRRYTYKYGIQIPISTIIGDGFYIGHFGNIVINKNAVIGRNCNIAQGVTIGQVNRGKLMGCPVIGDNVWIGANAVIVGAIRIGNEVLIAPNSFVNFDVPTNSLVISSKCECKSYENPTAGYINNVMGETAVSG
ncbi:serine acetyltransferase [Pedobacter gandavensis]|uniref:serine acetyltransferase n=1 Tax=Pedobacter gandavensis TaxID=2679963 RepID=UPI002930F442|nr:serine acetyltransferase [Pedobacter gandavensis]